MIKQASIKFKKNYKQTRNPFDRNQDPDKVYNIVTGLATMDSNQNVLVNVFKSEENEQKQILKNDCKTLDGLQTLSRWQKIVSFVTETGKPKITASNGKVLSACLMYDLFGSILYILLQGHVDMAQVLGYLLTTVSVSLPHVNGTMLGTLISSL